MAEIFVILYETPVYGRPEVQQTLQHRAVDEGTTGLSSPANPHFIGTFKSTVYARPIISSAPSDLPIGPQQVESNFIAQFRATTYRAPIISQPPGDLTNQANSESGANPHFIATFKPTKYVPALVTVPTDGQAIVVPDNPVNFLAKFLPVVFFNDIRLRQAQNTDFILTPNHLETPEQFIGAFIATRYYNDSRIRQFNTVDGLPPAPPPTTPAVYSRYFGAGHQHQVGALSTIPGGKPS